MAADVTQYFCSKLGVEPLLAFVESIVGPKFISAESSNLLPTAAHEFRSLQAMSQHAPLHAMYVNFEELGNDIVTVTMVEDIRNIGMPAFLVLTAHFPFNTHTGTHTGTMASIGSDRPTPGECSDVMLHALAACSHPCVTAGVYELDIVFEVVRKVCQPLDRVNNVPILLIRWTHDEEVLRDVVDRLCKCVEERSRALYSGIV
jgi:hypothetical protein